MSKKRESLKKHSLNLSAFSTATSPQSNWRNLIMPKNLLLPFLNEVNKLNSKPKILLSHQPMTSPTPMTKRSLKMKMMKIVFLSQNR